MVSRAGELSSGPGFDAALLALGSSFPLSLISPSAKPGATLFHSVLGDLQVNSDIIVIINEPVNLLIQCCVSVLARSTLNMVLRWLCETYAVVILTSMYIF